MDSSLKFTSSGDSTWYASSGWPETYYYDDDAASSYDTLSVNEESILQTIVDSDSSETLTFYWKVSSELYENYLEFWIDGTLQSGRISGEVDWTKKEYTISAGIHTLKWRYVKESSSTAGEDTGWVDFVQWTGASPIPDSENWQQIDYKYDVYGRRSEKIIDGYATRYLYDGGHVIAEYDGNNNLLRKYIYGPGIDKPVSMIEVADSNATYYYHYDALGSIIALSDSTGDTVQTYEYSVYGEVYVEDANHTNPYMFAGRRYDIEIGLYYNRARYYNPYTGRFLQTDPIGYGAGMNWYAYCWNNPLGLTDPSGCDPCDSNSSSDSNDPVKIISKVTGKYWVLPGTITPGSAVVLLTASEMSGLVVDLAGDISGINSVQFTEAMAKAVGERIIGAIQWRAWIEMQDFTEDGEKVGTPYWIEARGIGNATNPNPWVDAAGYLTWGDAMDAGGTAVDWAFKNGGVIPDNIGDEWLDRQYKGSVYVTNNPIRANGEIMKIINGGRVVGRFLKKVMDLVTAAPITIFLPW